MKTHILLLITYAGLLAIFILACIGFLYIIVAGITRPPTTYRTDLRPTSSNLQPTINGNELQPQ